ncbi:hypothetical protein HMPREF1210_02515 [Paenisporosarcina sp. HGH0030]|uniref:DUF4825 domain-containing protein n=1 Tax=Paenisporosarcina sp. HGH0030 TaxID=1078085 RepID=UPI00034E5633|nr:DUF4825 domain-containing protein [Paenisporosarcina sp. HGH0030]EPD50546.1 hypothetical protein HMPREF1210_02515 [Paenisporosarcina sp. HGH0030]
MKKMTIYFLYSLSILLFLNGCNPNNNVNGDKNANVFQYDGSFIGDNSAVINIINKLKHGEDFKEVSLETKVEPYGMTLKYEDIEESMIEKEYKETVIYNATFLFTLVENAEWITFNFEDQQYKITKEELQDWYGKELSEFTSEEELKNLIQKQIADEKKVDQLFEK